MNLLLFCRALWVRPPILLTITPTTATLSSLATRKNDLPIATFTPTHPLLSNNSLLTASFQLRTFLQTHLPPEHKKPFTLVVQLPEAATQPQLLATQIGGLLLSIKTPPSQILHRGRCVFFSSSPPYRLFRGAVAATCAALMLILMTSIVWLREPKNPESTIAPAAAMPIFTKAADSTALATILATLALHTPRHQLIELKKNANTLSYQTVCTHPQLRNNAIALLRESTDTDWKLAKTQYQSGYPPLYYYRATTPA